MYRNGQKVCNVQQQNTKRELRKEQENLEPLRNPNEAPTKCINKRHYHWLANTPHTCTTQSRSVSCWHSVSPTHHHWELWLLEKIAVLLQ